MLAYLGVLVGAMLPWAELFVIPPAIALGLSPVLVGILAATGNAIATVSLILGWRRLGVWWQRRTGRYLLGKSRRTERGRRAFERFGVPGLALQGPAVTGTFFAAIISLGLGARQRSVITWSLGSIALWSTLLVSVTVLGVSLF